MSEFIYHIAGLLIVMSCIYSTFTENLLRLSAALFLQVLCICILLVGLKIDYLAVVYFFAGLLGILTIVTFSLKIVGSRITGVQSSKKDKLNIIDYLPKAVSFLIGLFISGIIVSGYFYTGYIEKFLLSQNIETLGDVPLENLSSYIYNEHLPVYLMVAAFVLMVTTGCGVLLRKR